MSILRPGDLRASAAPRRAGPTPGGAETPASRAPAVRLLVLPILLALVAAAPGQEAAGPGGAPGPRVEIVQVSNGFPGGDRAVDMALQRVTVVGDRLRVLDESHLWGLFVSIPERRVREVAIDRREYAERPFAMFEKYRADRVTNRIEQAQEFLRRKQRFIDHGDEAGVRNLVIEYTRLGGNPSAAGALAVRLEPFPSERRRARVLVNREMREVTLEHYKIRENECAVPVFDLWMAEDLTLPCDVFAFYRALGTFGPEVDRKLSELRGTPIECTAVLDTGTFSRTFHTRILEVRTDPRLEPWPLDVPDGWTKVEAQRSDPERDDPEVPCAICGRRIRSSEALTYERRPYCSSEHRRQAITGGGG